MRHGSSSSGLGMAFTFLRTVAVIGGVEDIPQDLMVLRVSVARLGVT